MGTKEIRARLTKEKTVVAVEQKAYIHTKKLLAPVWAVGMTVARRTLPTVTSTVESLAAAGWHHPILFAEPDANGIPADTLTHWNQEVLGNWGNFCRRLKHMARMRADKYLLVQDDVEFLPDTREWLEDHWPCNEGMVSLYRSGMYTSHIWTEKANEFYDTLVYGKNFLGLLAVAMSHEHIKSLLLNLDCMADENRAQDDMKLGRYVHALRIPMNIVRQSRCQHTGKTSSIYKHTNTISNTRKADTYVK